MVTGAINRASTRLQVTLFVKAWRDFKAFYEENNIFPIIADAAGRGRLAGRHINSHIFLGNKRNDRDEKINIEKNRLVFALSLRGAFMALHEGAG
jgi:hypothetical protein